MSKFDSKLQKWIIKMPIMKDYRTLICRSEKDGVDVVMTYITEKDENDLDNNRKVFITRGEKKFKLEQSNVICYGQIDFNRGSDDYYKLEEIIPFNRVIHIPTDYNLEAHCCLSPTKRYRTTECSNISEICRYNYGVLDKPDRVAIFKTRIR